MPSTPAARQEGDFHDTLYIPVIPGPGVLEASVRVQPGPFTGYSVFHCQCASIGAFPSCTPARILPHHSI